MVIVQTKLKGLTRCGCIQHIIHYNETIITQSWKHEEKNPYSSLKMNCVILFFLSYPTFYFSFPRFHYNETTPLHPF
jgi:hypothetical protein